MAEADDQWRARVESLEWKDISGIHYLVDKQGKILGRVRKTADGTFMTNYGSQPHEDYVDLRQAREGVLRAMREAIELEERESIKGKKVEKKTP